MQMTVGRRVAPGSGRIAALPSLLPVVELSTPERWTAFLVRPLAHTLGANPADEAEGHARVSRDLQFPRRLAVVPD